MSGQTTTSIASRQLVAMLDAAGQPPDELLDAAGVSRTVLAAPDLAMPLAEFAELWRRAAALQPDIGLAMVERFGEGQMHMLAHLAMRSATVQGALDDACRHATVTSPADRLRCEVRDGYAHFSYACAAGAPANPWMAEHYLSMAVVFLARATGRTLPLRSVRFSASACAPLAAHVRRFGIEPRFSAGENALEFNADALAWPLRSQDDYLHALLEGVLKARATQPEVSFGDTVRREIATAVLKGQTPTLADTAQRCGIGTRALRDRLAAESLTFRALLDDVRRDVAREHLVRGMSVTETAYLLGFSEPAALQHACLRWFGIAAGRVRDALIAAD